MKPPRVIGPLVPAPVEVPMEERERAKRIFEATFGETDPAPSVAPPEEDSDIDIGRGKRRRLKLDALLADALKKGG